MTIFEGRVNCSNGEYVISNSLVKQIPSKEKNKSIKFDIVDFYPSITEELLMKSLNYAKWIEAINQNVVKVITHSHKSLLFDRDNIWVKKENPNFNVTMGSYNGAELCELTGLYILSILSRALAKEKIGLYRNNGLSCFQNMTGYQAERVKKIICKIFQSCDLKITMEANLQITDFLNANFNLKIGKHYPFRKPNNDLLYINAQTNS